MFEVMMYDGGIYRSDELFEMIEDVGGVVLQKNRSSQMLSVIMSIPGEDREGRGMQRGFIASAMFYCFNKNL